MKLRVSRLSRLRMFALLVLGFAAGPLAAVPLWSVEDAQSGGTALLLGSIHMLRAEDHPLPPAVWDAYCQADRVVLELDPADLDPAGMQAALTSIGFMTEGMSVKEMLDAKQWRRAGTLAEEAGLRLEAVAMFEPWFATIMLYTSALAAAGYEPALGVDRQVAGWTARDGKPVDGFESIGEQLRMFKDLAADVQLEMFLKTLEELAVMEAETAALVARWRSGDIEALARHLEEDFRDDGDLRARIVTDRNRAWVTAIEPLLATGETSLVVVGALHLVGPEGLPALLESRGYRVTLLDAN